jgi:hypothetical protein
MQNIELMKIKTEILQIASQIALTNNDNNSLINEIKQSMRVLQEMTLQSIPQSQKT